MLLSFSMMAFSLSSCSKDKGALPEGEFSLIGRVKEVGEKLLIEIEESEYMSGDVLVIYGENTKITDADGGALSLGAIKVGGKVEVRYNGQVMMSYPAQVAALRIILCPA